MNLYSVNVPTSVEDTHWYIVANSAGDAAQIYIDAVIDDQLSVDCVDMADIGKLQVSHVGLEIDGPARWIGWDEDLLITRRITPYSTENISIWENAVWLDFAREEGLIPPQPAC